MRERQAPKALHKFKSIIRGIKRGASVTACFFFLPYKTQHIRDFRDLKKKGNKSNALKKNNGRFGKPKKEPPALNNIIGVQRCATVCNATLF